MSTVSALRLAPPVGDDAGILEELPAVDREVLAQLLDRYLAEVETGIAPDLDHLMADHPHLVAPMQRYLDSLNFLHRAAAMAAGPSSANAKPAALPAERLLGDYRLVREIGRGGMGVVYEAWQMSLGRRVALKVLPFAAVLDPKYIARFHNEVRAAAQLQHPHIVPVYGVGSDRGVHYYSMQYIDGQPLDQAIREMRGTTLPTTEVDLRNVAAGDPQLTGDKRSAADKRGTGDTVPRPINRLTTHRSSIRRTTSRTLTSRDYLRSVVQLIIQAGQALHHAHEYGIVHRDIKPSNLLVDRQGQLWITDFGLARIQSSGDLTVSGEVMGTLRYMSPEQAAGRHAQVDQRSDVYSLGATLYELVTLRPAFPEEDRHVLLNQIAHQEPVPPRRLNAAIPHDLETVLLKAMSKQRESRYISALEFALDLQRYLDGHPTIARRPNFLDRASKWVGRHRRFAITTVCLLIMAFLASSSAAVLFAQKERAMAAARFQAESHLATAKQVVDRFGAEMSERLAGIPAAAEIRAEMLEESLRFYEDLAQYASDEPNMQRDAATAAFKAAGLAEQIGRLPRAAELFALAEARFAALDSSGPDVRELIDCCRRRQVLLAAIQRNNDGRVLLESGMVPESIQQFIAARADIESLASDPDDQELNNCLAGVLANLALAERIRCGP